MKSLNQNKESLLDRISTFYRNSNMKKKLNIALNSALLIPLTISFIYSVIFFGNKIQEEAKNKNDSDLNLSKFFYDSKVAEYEQIVSNFSNDRALGLLLSLNLNSQIANDLKNKLVDVDYDMLHVLDVNSRVVTRVHKPSLAGDIIEKDIYFNDAIKGKIASGTEVLKKVFLEREDINIGQETEFVLSIRSAAPLYNRITGEIAGVLIISKLLNNYSTFLSQIKKEVGEDIFIYQGEQLAVSSIPAASKGLSKLSNLSPEILSTIKLGNRYSQSNIISLSGFISAFLPFRNSNGDVIGALAVRTSALDFQLTFLYGFLSFLVIGIFGFLLAMRIRTVLSKYILLPIGSLRTGTQVLAKGNYDHKIHVENKDELGELSKAFNKMAEDLKQSYSKLEEYNTQLEKKVAERTKELVSKNDQLEQTLEMLNPGVSRLISSNKQALGLIEGTELVTDICGYTRLNILLSEEFVGNMMNEYYQESHKILAKYRGFRDKTVGDQTVACFGIQKDDFQKSTFHPFDAVVCATELNKLLSQMDNDLKDYVSSNKESIVKKLKKMGEDVSSLETITFQARTGINSSILDTDKDINQMRMVMMGGITGSDYTGQGGALICAARLEAQGAGKEVHLGENTANIIKNVFNLKELEPLYLKGLGTQKRFATLNHKYFFDYYNKDLKIQEYRSKIPAFIYLMLDKTSVGTITIKEVAKISKELPVSVRFLEHCCGKYNETLSRSIILYALAKELSLNENLIHDLVIGYASSNIDKLQTNNFNIKRDSNALSVISDAVKVNDTSYVNKITNDLNSSKLSSDKSIQLAQLVDSFDSNINDRTFLQTNKSSLKNQADFIKQFGNKFDNKAVTALHKLFK